jgi:methylglutaconyl-CoA hydratase
MAYEYLITRRDGAVEYLTLNRPQVRNAFNEGLIAELTAWAADVSARRAEVRAAVLTGAGPTFCAGADVTWMARTVTYTNEENLRDAEAASHMFAALNSLPIPLIGRIHGGAIGGGAGLAAVCDIVVADLRSVFGFTEVKLGILPAVIAPFVLAKIGLSAARELFLTGMRFSAFRARELGLVHAVVPEHEVDATVAQYIDEVLAAGPEAIAAAKSLIVAVWGKTIEDVRPITAAAIASRRVSAEGQEGLRAFLEKRAPSWSERLTTTEDTKDAKASK